MHPRGGLGPGASPWDLKSTRFSGFLVLNYVLDFRLCNKSYKAVCYVEGPKKPVPW